MEQEDDAASEEGNRAKRQSRIEPGGVGADQQIANNSAAQRGAERQHHEAEQIEIAVDRRQCTLEAKTMSPSGPASKQPAGVGSQRGSSSGP